MAVFRAKGKQNNAKIFLQDFNPSSGNSYFIGIGNSVTVSTDPVPVSNDSVQTDYTTWDNLFLMSQVLPSDISLMLKKYVWQENTRYEAFNKDINQAILGEKFYVFNESNNSVYLCMAAPPEGVSEYPPTGSSIDLEVKPDGYSWKFLYTISEDKMEKFNYPGYIPIEQIGTDLYTDDRLLQQQVSIASIKGSIESITLQQQGNVYAAAVNVNFANPIYSVASVGTVGDQPFVLVNPEGRNELILSNQYYNDNYVITFQSGYTAVIENSSIDPVTGYLKLVLCEVYTQNGSTVPPVQETFSILPRIKIIGNGSGAYAIPVLTTQKYISNVKLLDGGSNYSFVMVELPQINGTTVQPIIGLNGIGSDIIELFNVRHVMISKTIRPLFSLSAEDPVLYSAPENTGVVYEGSQYENIISPNTYYTQISLIKNPKLLVDNLQQVAGINYTEEREMVLEAIDPKIVIYIGTKQQPYSNSDDFFEIGDMIVRGPENSLDQFKAIITEIKYEQGSTVLTCDLLNGALETYAGYLIRNFKLISDDLTDTTTDGGTTDGTNVYATNSIPFVFEDCDNNCSQNIAHYYINAFRAGDFATDDVVLGSTSLSGAEIVKLPEGYGYVNPLYPTRVKIVIKNTDRTFLVARYENGVYVPGEVVSSFVITDGKPILKTRGRLVSISEPLTNVAAQTYGCAYILKCRINRGVGQINTPNALVNTDGISLETNTLIRQGLTGTVGKIIRTGIPVDESDIVYLYVNNYNNTFSLDSDQSDALYIINDLYEPTSYQNMKLFIEEIIYEPSVLRYSGNILYINDAGPIQRRIENSENLKLLVEF